MTRVTILKALRLYVIAASIVGLATVAGAAIRLSGHELVVNDSPSMPRGLYWIRLGAEPTRRGQVVMFRPPDDAASLIYERGWLPQSMPVLKPVGGLEADTYCIVGGRFRVNGADIGPVFPRDAQGLPMPQIVGCHRVGRDDFLPVSSYTDRSFDGRYMGVVPKHNVLGTGRALLTF